MADQVTEKIEEVLEEVERNPMVDAVRKVLLAGIGAVALAQEEAEDFVKRLVDRGEIAEKDGRRLLRDVVEKRKKQSKKAEAKLDARIEGVLSRINVPSKTDIDDLSAKITVLTKKVDELKKG